MPNCSIKKVARGTEFQSEPRRVCPCQVAFSRGTMVLVAGDLCSLFLQGKPLVRRSVPSAAHTGIKDKPAFPGILLPRRSTGMKEPVFPPPGKRSYTKESPETRLWGNWYATRIYLASIRGLSQVPLSLTYFQFRTSTLEAAGLGLIILRAQS